MFQMKFAIVLLVLGLVSTTLCFIDTWSSIYDSLFYWYLVWYLRLFVVVDGTKANHVSVNVKTPRRIV